MAGIQLTGLASGLDWKNVVDQLMSVERIPIFNLEDEKRDIQNENTKLSELSGLLETLSEKTKTLSQPEAFLSRTATLGTENSLVLAANPGPGTARGNYTFNISQIATASSMAGVADAGSAVSTTADVSGVTLADMRLATNISAGNFSVNGKTVTVDTADSLQDVFDAISTATGGTVTAAYNPTTDKIELSSASEIVLGSGADTSNFLSVTRLYSNGTGAVSSTDKLGLVDLDSPIADAGLASAITAVDGDGNGSFTLNGIAIAYNVNTDSLNDIMERIDDSDAGVNLKYDVANDRFQFVNKDTGTLGIGAEEAGGGLIDALGLSAGAGGALTLGMNAKFTLNDGGTLESTSNQVDASVHGIEGLSVSFKDTGTETVSVSADTEESREKVDAFIEAFNQVQSFIETQTSIKVEDGDVTTSALTDNREVSGLSRVLRQALFNPISGLSGAIKRLQDIGIDFDSGKDTISIDDSETFDELIATDGDLISELFSDAADGLYERLDTVKENYTGTDGIFSKQQDLLNDQVGKIDDDIADLERLLVQRRESLTADFLRMEEAQSQVQNQLAALTNSLGS